MASTIFPLVAADYNYGSFSVFELRTVELKGAAENSSDFQTFGTTEAGGTLTLEGDGQGSIASGGRQLQGMFAVDITANLLASTENARDAAVAALSNAHDIKVTTRKGYTYTFTSEMVNCTIGTLGEGDGESNDRIKIHGTGKLTAAEFTSIFSST